MPSHLASVKRRTLLQFAGAGSVGLLAGCTANGTGDDTGTETDSPTDSPSPSPSPSPDPGTIESTSFTVTKNECGTGQNSAEGRVEGSTVTVTGVIDGSDTCHTARLENAAVDDGTLTVAVVAYVPTDKEDAMCGECIVDIAYEATVGFDGGPPDRAVVTHDGERVTEFSLG